jgi:class 3 adenylate cyclase
MCRVAPIAERQLVSVVFADLVGFTSLSELRDAEEIRDLLSRYFELAVTLIVRYGETVEKFIGGAVMDVVIGRRLKAKGTSWHRPRADRILQLRLLKENKSWDRYRAARRSRTSIIAALPKHWMHRRSRAHLQFLSTKRRIRFAAATNASDASRIRSC